MRREAWQLVALAAALPLASGVLLHVGSPTSSLVFLVAGLGGTLVFALAALYVSRPRVSVVAARLEPPAEEETASGVGLVSWPEAVDSGANAAEQPAEAEEVDYLVALRHEFRTPLNAILGFCDVLLGCIDGQVNEAQREDLEIIRASGLKLRALLDNALDLSQLGWGRLRLERESFALQDMLLRATSEAKQLWVSKREAHFDAPAGAIVIEGDEPRLRRSVVALADFLATQYREEAIEVKLVPKGEAIHLEVAADSTRPLAIDTLPTPEEVLASDDHAQRPLWSIAISSEIATLHGGGLYRNAVPPGFVIRLPLGSGR